MNENNPLNHVRKMKNCLEENVEHLRSDIEKINEPQCKAIFETSAEVLLGLIKTLDDYEKKNESAWR